MSEVSPYLGWEQKWLNGQEYAQLLSQKEQYSAKYGFQSMGPKQHPEGIYTEPHNGVIYYVSGVSVGKDFGFPRVAIKKQYRWKKMNFKTNLPK